MLASATYQLTTLTMSNLQVSTRQHSGQRVLSQVVKVEVYKPLQIHPEYIYLTPGVSFVVITNDLLSSINLSQLYIYPLQDFYVPFGVALPACCCQIIGLSVLLNVKRIMVPEFYLPPQLSVKGGPKTGVYIEYSSLNMEIVEVQNATGKLSAKAVGNSVSYLRSFTDS